MTNEKIVYLLIKKSRGYIATLKFLQKYSFSEFESKAEIYWAIDRGLQLTIESSIDLGKEIITIFDYEKPETYQQVFDILRKHQAIDSVLCEKMKKFARFRNKLIHDYLYLDPKEIYEIFKKDLKYFEEYILAVEKFLTKK